MIDVDGDIFYMFQENVERPGRGIGILIHATENTFTKPGIYSSSWALELFKDFEGEVTLSND
jgi:hypothetical protein